MSKALNSGAIKQDTIVRLYRENADKFLEATGRIEHNGRHAAKVYEAADYILRELNYPDTVIILASIAGYLCYKVNFQLRTNNTGMA